MSDGSVTTLQFRSWLRAVWFALGELPACFRENFWAARRG